MDGNARDWRRPWNVRRDGARRVPEGWRRHGARLALPEGALRLLFPTPERGDLKLGVLLTTTGGLTGGDRLDIDVEADANAEATVSTQAAEKIYRSMGADCRVRVSLRVGDAAWLEWLMQETILFDGARLARRTEADVAPTGRLLAVESLVFGSAMGEDFRRGHVQDTSGA